MQKWDYFNAFCWCEEKCNLCLDDRKKPTTHWAINTNDGKHHWLKDGLNVLGAQGWELVTVQRHHSSSPAGSYNLTFWYILKRPIE